MAVGSHVQGWKGETRQSGLWKTVLEFRKRLGPLREVRLGQATAPAGPLGVLCQVSGEPLTQALPRRP